MFHIQVEDEFLGQDWLRSFATIILDAKYEWTDVAEVIDKLTHSNMHQKADMLRVLHQNNKMFDTTLGVHPHKKVQIAIDLNAQHELEVDVTNTLVTELKYASKATFEYLSAANGQYCQAVIDKGEEMVIHGLCANNDPSEGNFVTFNDILCSGGHINLSSASGIGWMRYNRDMVQCHKQCTMGKREEQSQTGLTK
jgi:hypothetical protein